MKTNINIYCDVGVERKKKEKRKGEKDRREKDRGKRKNAEI